MADTRSNMAGLPPISPVTPSVRSGASARPSARPASGQQLPAPSNASDRGVAVGSQRSGAAAAPSVARSGTGAASHRSGASGQPLMHPVSERSHQSQGSNRSVTSSVALGKLVQLEKMLLDERKAREDAESTMLALQRERIVKDDATRKQAMLEKQLSAVMNAVKSVVGDPDNPSNLRKLRTVLTGGTTVQTPTPSERNAVNSDGRPRSFLDGVGQYERERERARKANKADLAKKPSS